MDADAKVSTTDAKIARRRDEVGMGQDIYDVRGGEMIQTVIG